MLKSSLIVVFKNTLENNFKVTFKKFDCFVNFVLEKINFIDSN